MVADLQERRGIKHLCIHGKGGKLRFLPLHPLAAVRANSLNVPCVQTKKLYTSIADLVQVNNVSFIELTITSTGVNQRLNPCAALIEQLKTGCLDSDRSSAP
ncbi:Tyrosine recombinase XerC [Pseudomonas syringae pv. avellanae str. ISPaVe037]|nr:Tyrosine recombinase XerC [Pseudomonas syringae pv. avellanae str. ISPaVe037]